jgi:type II secretory pathway component PulM
MGVYLVVAVIYLLVSYPTSIGIRHLEHRLNLQNKKSARPARTTSEVLTDA